MLEKLTTEGRNPAAQRIDELTSLEIAQLMNREDRQITVAIENELPSIAAAIDVIADCLQRGGRLIYIGAGTSGRLGVLDASECPPTFNTDPEQVVGVIAGGYGALTRSIEGAEDHPESAVADLQEIGFSPADCLVGIATSGRTPYVVAALTHAQELGAAAIGIACNADSQLSSVSDITITPVVGPEVISGSTRLKAGTATKLVLNTLTTAAMVRLGKTYGDLMVDLRATNQKLKVRSRRIVRELTDLSEAAVDSLLDDCEGEVKTAIVVNRLGISPAEARTRLQKCQGHLRTAIEG
ncbi:MAG: N-acetylmuramic acid 6-phosphate etherase [Pirellulaceae bacterium]|nr:N-acetylmuramic acid 6-phosphate etherase [Pirellulaceae bacterium]